MYYKIPPPPPPYPPCQLTIRYDTTESMYTVKKGYRFSRPRSRDVTNQTKLNYSRSERVWLVTTRLGTGKPITFFYSVSMFKEDITYILFFLLLFFWDAPRFPHVTLCNTWYKDDRKPFSPSHCIHPILVCSGHHVHHRHPHQLQDHLRQRPGRVQSE